MTRFLWLWVLLAVLSLIIGPLWHASTWPDFFCQGCSPTTEVAATTPTTTGPEVKTPTPPPTTPDANMLFSWSDGNQLFQAREHFTFKQSVASPNVPESTREALQKISGYLKNNTTRQLFLTGLYTKEETKPANFPDLGIARADAVKQLLVGMGAPAASIQTNSQLMGYLPFNDTTLLVSGKDALNSLFGDVTAGAEIDASEAQAISELGSSLKARPMIIYFNTGESTINFPDEVKKYLEDTKTYFSKVPTARLSVTGHTDTDGTRDFNLGLARQRAARVSNLLTQQGFDKARLIIDSYGPDKPIASNQTESGKAKNRRVEIRVVD